MNRNYDADFVAKLLNMKKSAVYRLARTGQIDSIRIGQRIVRFPESALRKLVGDDFDGTDSSKNEKLW